MSRNLQPVLQSDRLLVRPLVLSDRAPLFAAAADPLIWEQHPEQDRYKPDVFLKFWNSALSSGTAFTLVDKASGAVLGSSRYYEYDAAGRSIAIGYTFLVRRCWGQGYNNELKRLMIDHAFSQADVVVFHIGSGNIRSRRAVEKTGATLYTDVAGKATYHLIQEAWLQQTDY